MVAPNTRGAAVMTRGRTWPRPSYTLTGLLLNNWSVGGGQVLTGGSADHWNRECEGCPSRLCPRAVADPTSICTLCYFVRRHRRLRDRLVRRSGRHGGVPGWAVALGARPKFARHARLAPNKPHPRFAQSLKQEMDIYRGQGVRPLLRIGTNESPGVRRVLTAPALGASVRLQPLAKKVRSALARI